MLRFTDHDKSCETQLQEALDCMLDVVRYVNDSLHQVSIVSFPVGLHFSYSDIFHAQSIKKQIGTCTHEIIQIKLYFSYDYKSFCIFYF